MSVNSIGLPPSTFSNVVSTLSGNQAAGAAGAMVSMSQLQRALRQQVDQAFSQNSSLPDTSAALADKVSETLQQYGISDDDRNAVLQQLQQVFAQAGSPAQARQNAQQVLDNFVQSLNAAPGGQMSASLPDAGQNLDFTA
jgi:pyruvate-formate lyase